MDGKASFIEVRNYLRNYNPKVTDEQVQQFMERRDMDGDGSVDLIPDYLMEVAAPDYSVQTAKEWFFLEDSNQDGYVTKEELVNIAMNIGMSREEAEQTAQGYYMSVDKNQDGQLDWSEYKTLYEE